MAWLCSAAIWYAISDHPVMAAVLYRYMGLLGPSDKRYLWLSMEGGAVLGGSSSQDALYDRMW